MLIRRIHPRLRKLVLLLALMIIETEAVLEVWLPAIIEMVNAVVGIRSIRVALLLKARFVQTVAAQES